MNEPKIVKLGKLALVGVPYFGNPKEGRFGETWHRYMQSEKSIQNAIPSKKTYGVEIYPHDFTGPENSSWFYLAGVEVANLEAIPVGLFGITLPACKYAVFTAVGGVSKLGEVFRYAYGEWLPASGYEMAHAYDFELYDERFKEDAPDSEIDIYLPIKAK